MKTSQIVSALRNAATPAARLAAWQGKLIINRRCSIDDYYVKTASMAERRRARINSTGPEISSPEAERPLLWLSGDSDPEILNAFAGRDFLDRSGWFADDYYDATLETYAVQLHRFPRLMFYSVMSESGLRVELSEWEEIDFSECENEYQTDDAIQNSARFIILGNDSSTKREAEESIEFYRKDQVERDIEENKETLATLRREIRTLAHELKTLCQSSMSDLYPVAAKAVLQSLKSLLRERRELMERNQELAASL